MSQISSESRRFLVPLHWLHAGGDLAQPSIRRSRRPSPVYALQSAAEIPIARFQAPLHTLSGSPQASFAPTIITGAKIKSP